MKLVLSQPHPTLDLDDLSLTDEQQSAMAFDREVVVTAGAGSGKTHTLALRYVALLLHLASDYASRRPNERPCIRSVLVLTFTDKAATEMKERCYQRLLDLIQAVREGMDDLVFEGTSAPM